MGKRRLQRKVVISVIITVAVTMAGVGLLNYDLEKKTSYEDMEEQADRCVGRLQNALPMSVWNLDYETAEDLCRSELADPMVRGIVILEGDSGEAVWMALLRRDDGSLEATESPEPIAYAADQAYTSRAAKLVYRDAAIGRVAVHFSDDHIRGSLRVQAKGMLTLTALMVVVISLVLTVLLRLLVLKPLSELVARLRDISEGEGDLTTRLDMGEGDEFGELAEYFNSTIAKIRRMVASVVGRTEELSTLGRELAVHMEETAAAIAQIGSNIRSIKHQTANQSAGVAETGGTMEQIRRNIERLDGHIERQGEALARSSSAVEQMLANIASVSRGLSLNAKNLNALSHAAEKGKTGLMEVSALVQDVSKESQGLLEISGLIQQIASRTNLLSMNAAIEAAHAGEAGKGFAVVADEIRKLADSSGVQAKTASKALARMVDAVGNIMSSTAAVSAQFEEIYSKIAEVADRERLTQEAMEEQNAGSKEILEALGGLHEITGEVKSGSKEMLIGSREVLRESENLGKITTEIDGGMNEMAAGTEQITEAVVRVSELGKTNKECVDTLFDEVSKFKIA